jgi:transposase
MLYFHLVLTQPQKQKLIDALKVAREKGDLTVVNRILVVLAYAESSDSFETIASILHVSTEFVRAWIKKYVSGGIKVLTFRKRQPGRPRKLTKTQRFKLEKLIKEGPQKAGFPGACWRSPMVQELILKEFKVFYNAKYISQLLNNMGFSYQKARFKVGGKDPKNADERLKWLNETWPEALALAKQLGAYLFFEDETSFPQWGTLSYTWAKKGQQPTIETWGIRKGYKVFGLIDYFTGRFFHKATPSKFNSQTYIDFLQKILVFTRKHIVLIHDGAPYHKSALVKEFISKRANRLTVYKLPSYSPDFNPIEQVWKEIKKEEIHLQYFPTFESLQLKVDEALENVAKKGKKLLSLFGFYNKLEVA